MMQLSIKTIAKIYTDFPDKFGIPRQSGLADQLKARIVFEKEYRNPDAVRGLEDFSHIWLLWHFSQVPSEKPWSATVRPPRLGGNQRIGVFATRSPYRPNPIGLSCVELDFIEIHPKLGAILYVKGADLMNETPILDIKPYLNQADCILQAQSGFADRVEYQTLQVEIPQQWLEKIPFEKQQALRQVLEQDPRPSYHTAPDRIYGMNFAEYEVRFRVRDRVLLVCEITKR